MQSTQPLNMSTKYRYTRNNGLDVYPRRPLYCHGRLELCYPNLHRRTRWRTEDRRRRRRWTPGDRIHGKCITQIPLWYSGCSHDLYLQNEYFFMGAEDGTVWQYEVQSGRMEKLLVRCALPVRDIAVTKDKEWVAVASE